MSTLVRKGIGMCGRYAVSTPTEQLATHFNAQLPAEWQPRRNAAPSQNLPVLLNDGSRRIHLLNWGFVPSWSPSTRLINARAETLTEKPTFRNAFQRRRCLVLADAFYEWQAKGKHKQPMRFALSSTAPFAFAGIWEQRDETAAFLIITTTPNALVAPVHNRMPVILPPEAYALWLDNTTPAEALQSLLVAFPADQMACTEADSALLRDFTA